MYCKCAPV